MVYIVEVKPGLFYAYRSVRLPGHKYPVKQYIGPASQTMISTKRSPTPDKSSSQERLDYKRSVLRLFDPDLTANGQSWHIDDILEQLSETYGSGHERQISSAVVALVDSGRLQEISPGNYRRVA